MIRQQRPFPSSVVQMARLPSSLPESSDRRQMLGPIAVAAYSYMSLVPIIQPPIMKLLTTEKERKIKMETASSGFQAGEDPVPDYRNNCCMSDSSYNRSPGWYADAR